MQQHIITAATVGMKAGYNARKAVCKRSGLPQVRAAAKQSFRDYCNEFGPKVDRYVASMKHSSKSVRPVAPATEAVGVIVFEDEGIDPQADELATLRQRIAEIEAERTAAKTAPKTAPKVKLTMWHPWAIRKYNIPTEVGGTFEYVGKRRKSTFQVVKVTAEGVQTIRVA